MTIFSEINSTYTCVIYIYTIYIFFMFFILACHVIHKNSRSFFFFSFFNLYELLIPFDNFPKSRVRVRGSRWISQFGIKCLDYHNLIENLKDVLERGLTMKTKLRLFHISSDNDGIARAIFQLEIIHETE